MDQAVDALLELDERAVTGQVAHPTGQPRADGVLVGRHAPGVELALLDPERYFLLVGPDRQHHRLDDVALAEHLARVADAPRPAHLADVDQPLDAFGQLDEGAVGLQAHDPAAHDRADRVLDLDVVPGIRLELLEAQGDALALAVEVQHLDAHHLADLEHLARVPDAAPAHVGDVQQAVEAEQVDKRAEVGQVLDHAGAHLAVLDLLDELLAVEGALLLEQLAAAHHHVATLGVDLDQLELERLADVVLDVRHVLDVDLARRQERVHADVDDEAAAHLAHDAPADLLAFLAAAHGLLPAHLALRLDLAQHDQTVGILELLEEDVDLVAHLVLVDRRAELADRNHPFGLVADVDHHVLAADQSDPAFEQRAFFDFLDRAVVEAAQLLARHLAWDFDPRQSGIGSGCRLLGSRRHRLVWRRSLRRRGRACLVRLWVLGVLARFVRH